jgi:hypothetical protein
MCGKPLHRKYFGKRLEDWKTFKKRLFCSLSCANSRYKGGLSRNAFMRMARKHKKPACECCGDKRYLHVHHLDGDFTNNDPINLQTLCVFCHHFWHALHWRRGEKIAGGMPRLGPHWQ